MSTRSFSPSIEPAGLPVSTSSDPAARPSLARPRWAVELHPRLGVSQPVQKARQMNLPRTNLDIEITLPIPRVSRLLRPRFKLGRVNRGTHRARPRRNTKRAKQNKSATMKKYVHTSLRIASFPRLRLGRIRGFHSRSNHKHREASLQVQRSIILWYFQIAT